MLNREENGVFLHLGDALDEKWFIYHELQTAIQSARCLIESLLLKQVVRATVVFKLSRFSVLWESIKALKQKSKYSLQREKSVRNAQWLKVAAAELVLSEFSFTYKIKNDNLIKYFLNFSWFAYKQKLLIALWQHSAYSALSRIIETRR